LELYFRNRPGETHPARNDQGWIAGAKSRRASNAADRLGIELFPGNARRPAWHRFACDLHAEGR
jgi:hypothetical protein